MATDPNRAIAQTLMNLLGAAAPLAQITPTNIGAGFAQAPGVQQAVQGLAQVSPAGVGAGAISALSEPEAQAFNQGQQQAMKEFGKQEAQARIQQMLGGVSTQPGQFAQQSMQDSGVASQIAAAAQSQGAQAPQQRQAPQQQAPQQTAPQQSAQLNPLDMLGRALGLFSEGVSESVTGLKGPRRLTREAQIAGEAPLTQFQRASLQQDVLDQNIKATQFQQKNLNERVDKYLEFRRKPIAAAKELSLVETALTAVDNIIDILGITTQDGSINVAKAAELRNQNWLSKNRQALLRARQAYINKALRRDTGAAIGKEEEKQFQDTYGFDVGVKSFFQNPEVIAKSLLEAQDQLVRDRSRLDPASDINAIFDTLSKKYGPREAGRVMAERGLI